MYSRCSMLPKAQKTLKELPTCNVVSWNVLITGYVQQGKDHEALSCFRNMKTEGIAPDAVTFTCILKACGKIGAIDKGKELHDEIVSRGLLKKDIVLGTALVDMYVKCGELQKAHIVLEELYMRNIVSWSALIAGYVQQGQGHEALSCFEQLQNEGLSPDVVTFTFALKACGSIRAIDKGMHIHKEIVKKGLEDLMLNTSLVDMYAKCGSFDRAKEVLKRLPVRDVVSWNSLIARYVQQGNGCEALDCFKKMKSEGLSPDGVTFICILKACGSIGDVGKGMQIHDEIVATRLLKKDIVLGTALVDMYAKCGLLARAHDVLNIFDVRNIMIWSALVAGYVQQGKGYEALECLKQMQSEGFLADVVTFICALKACGSTETIEKGTQFHNEILGNGLLEKDIALGNALVDMYAKLGVLPKAQQVLDELPVRDLVSWNALIAGYVQQRLYYDALDCFEQMQNEGLSPDEATFVSMLKACGFVGALDRGKAIHDTIVSRGFLGKDVMLGNSLVDMYAKCRELAKSQEVLEDLLFRSTVSWNSVIAGYAQQGQLHKALNCLKEMKCEGLSPDAITFIYILTVCGISGAIDKGKEIHYEIRRRDLLLKNVALGNALVDMYVKCGVLAKAQEVHEEIPVRDVISWNSLIAGYAHQGYYRDAFHCFEQMQVENLFPDGITFMCILKACGKTGAAEKRKLIHMDIMSRGLIEKDITVCHALIEMYANCGMDAEAQKVLEDLPVRDTLTCNAVIAGYMKREQGQEALNCFEWMENEGLSPDVFTIISILKACGKIGAIKRGKEIHEIILNRCFLDKNVALGTTLVNMYAKWGMLEKAQQVLKELPVQEIVSLNALISGYVQHRKYHEALTSFESVQSRGFTPDPITFFCILKACANEGAIEKGKQIHDEIASRGLLENDLMLGHALVNMYAKCGALAKARKVLQELTMRDVVDWNALITGYILHGQSNEALNCFEQMQSEGLSPNIVTFICILKACGIRRAIQKGKQIHDEILRRGWLEQDIMLGNVLVDMYAKCHAIAKAQKVLLELPMRNIVSWNTLIAGYCHLGQCHEALECFEQMLSEGLSPDFITFLCILKACGSIGALEKGKQIHQEIVRTNLVEKDNAICNALVDMYVKCGMLEKAQEVLEDSPIRDVVSWNVMVSGYAEQGQGHEALKCFERMQSEGVSPDEVTFLCVLSACGFSGLFDDAQIIFENMAKKYEISPNLKHHTYLVGAFGCGGHFNKAMSVMKSMPCIEYPLLWIALLSTCVRWGNVKVGRMAFDHALRLDDSCAAPYILMWHIFQATDMTEDTAVVKSVRYSDFLKARKIVWRDLNKNLQ